MVFTGIEKIKVGPIRYQLVFVERLLAEDKIKKLNGWIRYDEAEILVDAELCAQRQALTILHEVGHAIFENAGLDGEQGQDEQAIDVMAHGLLGFIQDNPELIQALQEINVS